MLSRWFWSQHSLFMLRTGILNPALLHLLARIRHTNTLVIADRGFPFWPQIETVDISLVDNIPSVLQVLAAIRGNFQATQAYMAAGRPILMAVRGEAASLIEKARAGIACTPEDPESIAAAVGQFCRMPRQELDAMGERGWAFYQAELSLEVGSGKFNSVFQSLL